MAAANFEACLAFVLRQEGGKADLGGDPGGRTNFGITQATYDAWRRSRGLYERSVYLIIPDERDYIYRTRFWNPINGNALRPGEDLAVLDYAVNSGPGKALPAWRWASRSTSNVDVIIRNICSSRLTFLHRLMNWRRFGADWGRRVRECQAIALQMSAKQRQQDAVARIAAQALARSPIAPKAS